MGNTITTNPDGSQHSIPTASTRKTRGPTISRWQIAKTVSVVCGEEYKSPEAALKAIESMDIAEDHVYLVRKVAIKTTRKAVLV